MSDHSAFRFATRAVHAGQRPDPATGAVTMPIYQTSTYVQNGPGELKGDYDYSRSANPIRTALEANLASLEQAKHGLCFASGCAALAGVIHLLHQGDHVILGDDVYGGSFRLLNEIFQQLGISYTQVDMTDLTALKQAFTPTTKLVWLETPTNPTLKIADIAVVAEITKQHHTLLAVDNTFATPWLQKPLALGADIVCHSTTKYIGGHSDIIGGALMVNDSSLDERLRSIQGAVGAVPGPMECFLLLRSTKTLHVRMQRHCENAATIASFLESHPAIERVIYPGLSSHPQHAIALEQMKGFGGMITFYLKGNMETSREFLGNVSLFALAVSLGGVESLIEHPATMTHASVPEIHRNKLNITDNLIRVSVGIEDIQDLKEDLNQALNQL